MKGTGHNTGPMMRRDLTASLEAQRVALRHKQALRMEKQLKKQSRHGKKQLPGGELA